VRVTVVCERHQLLVGEGAQVRREDAATEHVTTTAPSPVWITAADTQMSGNDPSRDGARTRDVNDPLGVAMSLDNPLHLAFLLLLVLLVFGAKRLPELGRSLGSGMRGFRDALAGVDPDAGAQAELTRAEAASRVD
jgi:sec-independent protein translocase protein TatA